MAVFNRQTTSDLSGYEESQQSNRRLQVSRAAWCDPPLPLRWKPVKHLPYIVAPHSPWEPRGKWVAGRASPWQAGRHSRAFTSGSPGRKEEILKTSTPFLPVGGHVSGPSLAAAQGRQAGLQGSAYQVLRLHGKHEVRGRLFQFYADLDESSSFKGSSMAAECSVTGSL